MARKVKAWVWVVLGLLVTCVLAIVAIAGAAYFFFSRHVDTRRASPAAASREFDAVTGRFAGQKPLVELDVHGNFVRTRRGRPSSGAHVAPEHLFVLAFDPDDGRVVRLKIPFWLLRFKPGSGSIDLNGSRMDLEDLKLTVQDLEQLGPTLIVDRSMPDGNRVLVWSQ